jgi:hypothetical protein
MAGGACFWALYLVTYKKFVGDPSHTTINVQSTLVGLISVFFSWPVLFILHYTGAEKFELPSGTSGASGVPQHLTTTSSLLVLLHRRPADRHLGGHHLPGVLQQLHVHLWCRTHRAGLCHHRYYALFFPRSN